MSSSSRRVSNSRSRRRLASKFQSSSLGLSFSRPSPPRLAVLAVLSSRRSRSSNQSVSRRRSPGGVSGIASVTAARPSHSNTRTVCGDMNRRRYSSIEYGTFPNLTGSANSAALANLNTSAN